MKETLIHYGPNFAREIRQEGIEKTIKKWEEWTGKPLRAEFHDWGGLTIREKDEKA